MFQQLFCFNGFSFNDQSILSGCCESRGDAFIVTCQYIRVISMRNVIRIDAHRYRIVNVLDIATAKQIAEINRPSAGEINKIVKYFCVPSVSMKPVSVDLGQGRMNETQFSFLWI